MSGEAVSSGVCNRSEFPLHAKSREDYFSVKRIFDICFALLAFPILLTIAVLIWFANPVWNPGPVFFRQVRMGRDGRAFTIWKFRTMTENGSSVRCADAPLESHRITSLGRLLRRTKLDELPNVLNILLGDMSLVGPRPDAIEHAAVYIGSVPHYHKRFSVRPGITGLAQVRGGYADSPSAVCRKARYDSFYIQNRSFLLELFIIASTFGVVFSGLGQR